MDDESTAEPQVLHPLLEPVRVFVGHWQGTGTGDYPTIDPFAYVEDIHLVPVPGKPLLAYRSATRHPETGQAMHAESGWLRPVGGDAVELVLAQGSGLVEVAEGRLHPAAGGGELLLASSLVAGAGTAKEVSATERRYRVAGDRLDYDLAMAAVGVPMTHHLHGSLDRVGPGDRGATGS
jgi:hypothetical protein